jgi:HAD superfamily hydrolase (TIGR01509 family)
MKAIIFDCDGTLVDSEVLGTRVLCGELAALGHAIDEPTALSLFRGSKMADLIHALETRFGCALPPTFVPDYRARLAVEFREHLRPMPGARETLEALTIPVCVASSGPRDKIELSLSLTGLRDYFGPRVYSAYDVGVWKPDPGLFLHAARSLEVLPEDCAVVEDSLPGVTAGLAAGMTVFALVTPGLAFELPPTVHALGSLYELAAIVGTARA